MAVDSPIHPPLAVHHLVINGLVLGTADGELSILYGESSARAAAVVVEDLDALDRPTRDGERRPHRLQQDRLATVVQNLVARREIGEASVALLGYHGNQRPLSAGQI